MTILPFEPSDEAYEMIAALDRAAWPEDSQSLETYRARDAMRDPKYFYERYVLWQDGVALSYGEILDTFWAFRPNKYLIDWSTIPSHEAACDQMMLNFFEEKLISRGATLLQCDAREDKPKLQLLIDNGYELAMREPISQLTIADFDLAPYDQLEPHLLTQGIQILSLRQLKLKDPDTWAVKLEELSWQVLQDVPTTDPYTRDPLDQWLKNFQYPNRSDDAYFVAVAANGDYVGLSYVRTSAGHKLDTGLTGVLPHWRRKGIATALKVAVVRYAKTTSFTIIETDNEENNPMYGLNMQLGFQPCPAWMIMLKTVAAAE